MLKQRSYSYTNRQTVKILRLYSEGVREKSDVTDSQSKFFSFFLQPAVILNQNKQNEQQNLILANHLVNFFK
ncbi:MAG: hypothetical protein ACI8P3_002268 [Saprospiraceae bacterium]